MAMASVSFILLSLLPLCGTAVLAEDNSVDGFPSFCGDYECPKYQILKRYNTFELRSYEATRWMTTQLDTDMFGLGIMKSFKRLYNYFNGKNTEGVSIKMTVPVRAIVPLFDQSINATMCFFVPTTIANPPAPTDSSLYLDSLPPTSYYVRSFSGYALKSDYEKESKALSEELEDLGLAYDMNFGIAAGYNDPLTFFKRHNEVWFRAQ
ncbi:heme-binding protein 2-like [Bufo gargarizans]|uniref:heme-binding protein 2-like n=1 Tax=Bufo gargarizans TaxID=30331 RepID=UPI001CF1CE42|nr:heme-binding protein 2-like [Bufo gargarizans]